MSTSAFFSICNSNGSGITFGQSLSIAGHEFPANSAVGTYLPTDTDLAASGTGVTKNAFIAGAVGSISSVCTSSAKLDIWQIDHTKTLVHFQSGI